MKLVNCLLNKRHQSGFSLLETLIASTIFAVILLLASSAFKFFMSVGTRSVNSASVMQETMALIDIRSSIKGMHHYYIRNSGISLEPKSLFFSGINNSFSGITNNGIDFPYQPSLIKVSTQVQALNESAAIEESNTQNINLIYCEYDNSITFPQRYVVPQCEKPKIIVSNIKEARFSYFGWLSLDALYGLGRVSGEHNSIINNKEWSSSWYANKRGVLPQYIKVELEYNDEKVGYKPSQLWFKIADADPVQFKVNNTNVE